MYNWLSGAPCDPHDGLTCVDRSVCIERDNYIFQCDCDDGFIDTPDGSCQLGLWGYLYEDSYYVGFLCIRDRPDH